MVEVEIKVVGEMLGPTLESSCYIVELFGKLYKVFPGTSVSGYVGSRSCLI